jgi:multisubunit Na+/H+ antiporter MnhE subunit
MTGFVLRVGGLVAIYLLVLTSLAPGDVLVAASLATALVLAARGYGPRRDATGWGRWTIAFASMIAITAWEIAVGTVRVARFCLTGVGNPGFVQIPRGDRSRHAVALWGVLTGEAPDEYPVAVDDERGVLIVHNVDATDPAAIQARHAAARAAYLRDVVR